MNQRKVNKIIKNGLAVLWLYHFVTDEHIQGHKWLHVYQYNMIRKHAPNIKFKQIRKNKYYKSYVEDKGRNE